LDPASAEVIAKRQIKLTTKISDNVFFIETPSFPSNLSSFIFLDGRRGNLFKGRNIGRMGQRNDGTKCQQRIRKRKLLVFLPNVPLFQYSIIPG
jgi:hypothetical protein